MAETEQLNMSANTNQINEHQKLKYLDFVQVAVLHVIVCFASVYDYAKDNSGPLKPGVQTVEDTVKTVIGPVYEKFHDVPFELLKFVDRKVDDSVGELDFHVPNLVKEATTQVYTAAQKAPGLARAVASEVQQSGLIDTGKAIVKNLYTSYEPTAKEIYTKYEPVAEQYAVSAWRKLNTLPLFPQVAHVMVPTAAYWSEKYNQTVSYTAEKGFVISTFLPLVPTERIAKVFGETEAVNQSGSSVSSASSSDNESEVTK